MELKYICSDCKGYGVVNPVIIIDNRLPETNTTCPICRGNGEFEEIAREILIQMTIVGAKVLATTGRRAPANQAMKRVCESLSNKTVSISTLDKIFNKIEKSEDLYYEQYHMKYIN